MEYKQQTVLITGNTYPVKDAIKALGGKWDQDAKGWRVPMSKADAAKSLVANAPKNPSKTCSGPRKCRVCGHIERRNSRGYIDGDRILKSGECQSCYEERKMGY